MKIASGRYFDGRTAAPRSVEVSLDGDDLVLSGESGAAIRRWPLADVRLVDGGPGDPVGRFTLADSDERITLDNYPYEVLSAHCGNLLRPPPRERRATRKLVAWSLGAAAALLLTIFVLLPWLAQEVAVLVPPEAERKFGERIFPEVVSWLARVAPTGKPPRLCVYPRGRNTLDTIVGRLESAQKPRLPLQVVVVDRLDMENAFALPGGRIIITERLLLNTNSEDELAGVIAHEMGHIDARHSIKALVRSSALGILLGLVFGDILGGVSVVGAADYVLNASFSREAEREADRLAILRLKGAGYDPARTAEFFNRMASKGSAVPALLSTHPLDQERAAGFMAVSQERRFPASDWVMSGISTICHKGEVIK